MTFSFQSATTVSEVSNSSEEIFYDMDIEKENTSPDAKRRKIFTDEQPPADDNPFKKVPAPMAIPIPRTSFFDYHPTMSDEEKKSSMEKAKRVLTLSPERIDKEKDCVMKSPGAPFRILKPPKTQIAKKNKRTIDVSISSKKSTKKNKRTIDIAIIAYLDDIDLNMQLIEK